MCRTWFWCLVVKEILINIMLSVLLRVTDSYYPFGIFKLLYHGADFYHNTSSTRKVIDLPSYTVYQLLADGRWFPPGTPASSTTKTGRHDITEILLKVTLNTIKQTNKQNHRPATSYC